MSQKITIAISLALPKRITSATLLTSSARRVGSIDPNYQQPLDSESQT